MIRMADVIRKKEEERKAQEVAKKGVVNDEEQVRHCDLFGF